MATITAIQTTMHLKKFDNKTFCGLKDVDMTYISSWINCKRCIQSWNRINRINEKRHGIKPQYL
jgi:lipoate-protein ligase B